MNHRSPPETVDAKQLVVLLHWVGSVKNLLPFNRRGNLSVMGIHVQLSFKRDHWNLKAGGTFRTYFEADSPPTSEMTPGNLHPEVTSWNVTKYDTSTWQKRFAKVVWPMVDLTTVLTVAIEIQSENGFQMIDQAISAYEQTGHWTPIATGLCSSCNSVLEVWDQWKDSCYQCGKPRESGPFNQEGSIVRL